MNIISQTFIQKQLISLGFRQIKFLISRQRIKFSIPQISEYLHAVFIHQNQHKSFKNIYKKSNFNITYQGFMKNIATLCPLIKFLFYKLNKQHNVKPSSLYNVVDTSLIPTKFPESIKQQDFDNHNVTARVKNKIKIYICGVKLLVFTNRFRQIYYAQFLNINYSDQNILKSSALYEPQLRGFLLADKGFNGKEAEKRVNFSGKCKIISPKNKNCKIQLNKKERKIYKKRWSIETVFQNLKNIYGEFKLDLKGAKNKKILEGKLFSALTEYNLTKI
jgi:hypothetical protein